MREEWQPSLIERVTIVPQRPIETCTGTWRPVRSLRTGTCCIRLHERRLNRSFDGGSTDWKNQLLAKAADVFSGEPRPDEPTVDLKVLHAKIASWHWRTIFRWRAHQGRRAERKAMIDRTQPLPITRQAALVSVSRGSVYCESQPGSDADLKLMRRIDELHQLEILPWRSADLTDGLSVPPARHRPDRSDSDRMPEATIDLRCEVRRSGEDACKKWKLDTDGIFRTTRRGTILQACVCCFVKVRATAERSP